MMLTQCSSRQLATAVELLAHRGLWRSRDERNSLAALRRAFQSGYGVETDLRDRGRDVVVSHDPSDADSLDFRLLLDEYVAANCGGVLALNIKADGLAEAVERLLLEYRVERYFVFDMSVPDMIQWERRGLRYFTRQSEYEQTPALYRQAAGVWLDAFHDTWFDSSTIEAHLLAGKSVCVVSPELHGRDPQTVWRILESVRPIDSGSLSLCTDIPDQWTYSR